AGRKNDRVSETLSQRFRLRDCFFRLRRKCGSTRTHGLEAPCYGRLAGAVAGLTGTASSNPIPVTFDVDNIGPEIPDTLIPLSFAFAIFTSVIPFSHSPVTVAISSPFSGFSGGIDEASTSAPLLLTLTF